MAPTAGITLIKAEITDNQIKIEYMVDDEVFIKEWNERGDIRKETHTLIGQASGM